MPRPSDRYEAGRRCGRAGDQQMVTGAVAAVSVRMLRLNSYRWQDDASQMLVYQAQSWATNLNLQSR